jgi:methyltransferase (TIGR00027 family)
MKLASAWCFAAATLCALPVPDALAVRPGQPSGTAEVVCAYRGIAAQHPDPKLRNPDYLAGKFCSRPGNLPTDYAGARQMIDISGASYAAYFMINVRTHYIDAALRRAAADGATQVVILGAGYDSRAYRFRESHPQLRFFEVDLPTTSAKKRERLVEVFGAVPDYVRYAPIDFDRQTLEEVLSPLGYDPKQRTFFVLEGVTMYVTEAGNGATLDFIRRHSAPGSRVVFDYLLRPVIEGRYQGYWAADFIAFMVAQRGEPYVTGWTPPEAAAFAKKHGLVVVDDVGDQELTKRHNLGSDGKPDGRLLNWQRFLEAAVP